MLEPDLLIIERLLDLRATQTSPLPPAGPSLPRTDCVILVTGVSTITDSEISNFFRRTVTPVRDIQRPATTTDVAFVEFFCAAGVSAALALENPEIAGTAVDVRRPRVAVATTHRDWDAGGRSKVYVGGIEGELLNFTKNDWKEIMEIFGVVEEFSFPVCVYTGQGLGAFELVYRSEKEAREAVDVMNGRIICGVTVKAGIFV
jgi:hypothetical protein